MLCVAGVLLTAACGGRILQGSDSITSEDDPAATTPDSRPDAGEKSQAAKFTDPFAPGQDWTGTYTCEQGLTDLDLKIVAMHDDTIDDALFDFDWEGGPTTGSYHLSGSFDPSSGIATLTPGNWVDQPSGWISVGMSGPASENGFSGNITNGACTTFSITKS